MNGIARIRSILKYTQAQFAEFLRVSRSTVAMWEKGGQEPSYDTVSYLADVFNLPSDYIMMRGIFHEWDKIISYYPDIAEELNMRIPAHLKEQSKRLFSTTLYPLKEEEFQFVRWFSSAVKHISIHEDLKNTPEFVDIEFTPEFQRLIQEEKSEPAPKDEDGFEERALRLIRAASCLSDEQREFLVSLLELTVERLPRETPQIERNLPERQEANGRAVPADTHSHS